MSASEQTSDSAAWALVAALLLPVAALEWRSPLPIDPSTLGALLTACAALGATALFYRTVRQQEKFAVICIGLAQMLLFSAIGSILSYLLTREGGALWDSRLTSWDRGLGFDWLAYVRFFDAHEWIAAPARWAYASLIPQIVVLVLSLGFTAQLATLRRLLLAAMLSGAIAVLLSPLFPAVGHYIHDGLTLADFQHIKPWAGYSPHADFTALRNGTMGPLRLSEMEGIIIFPSYHACLSLVLMWGFWASRMAWLRWPGIALAALTIAATPVDGGHYLVDVLAGMAIAGVSLAAAGRAIRWCPTIAMIRSSPFRRSHAAFGQ